MKKKWLSAAVAATLSVCALTAPISVPNTVTPVAVQAASPAQRWQICPVHINLRRSGFCKIVSFQRAP